MQNRTFGATQALYIRATCCVNYNFYSSFMLEYNTSKLAEDGDDNALSTQQQQRRLDDTYQPLDEIQLTRDFRASLILTQLGHLDPLQPSSLSSSISSPQVANEAVKSHSVHNTTPPLSPSSSTSEVRGGGSNSSRSNSEIVAGVPTVATATVVAPKQQPANTMKGVN